MRLPNPGLHFVPAPRRRPVRSMTRDEARAALEAIYAAGGVQGCPVFARELVDRLAAPGSRPRAWCRWPFELGYLLPTGSGAEHVVVGRGISWDHALENARRKIRRQGRLRKPRKTRDAGRRAQLALRLFTTLSLTLPSVKAQGPIGGLRCPPGSAAVVQPLYLWLYGQV